MSRKRWFQVTALLFVLVAGVIALRVGQAQQNIRFVPASIAEGRIHNVLKAFVALTYEVGPKLPAGTEITHWIEYYTMGEREDIAKRSITLSNDEKKLSISLVAQEQAGQEGWYVIVGADSQIARLPEFFHTVSSIGWQTTRKVQYGQPMLLAYGLRGVERTSPADPDHEASPFETDSVAGWLHNDNVWAFKIQIDLPER